MILRKVYVLTSLTKLHSLYLILCSPIYLSYCCESVEGKQLWESSITSLHSFTNSTSWRLWSGLLPSVQSLCINAFTGLQRHTSSTNSVRWRTLRLISDFIQPRLHHWLSDVLDCPLSVTGLFQLLLLVFGKVCLNTSPRHPLWLSSCPVFRLICSPSRIQPLSLYHACAVMLLL